MTEQHLSFPGTEGKWSVARREWLEVLGASGHIDQPDLPPFMPDGGFLDGVVFPMFCNQWE